MKIQTVDSPALSLGVGQNTSTVGGTSWRATCPAGSYVVGTGFDAGIGNVDFVNAYGTFVGGFVHNDVSITITGVTLQAICAQLPPGATAASTRARSRALDHYKADLEAAATSLEAARK